MECQRILCSAWNSASCQRFDANENQVRVIVTTEGYQGCEGMFRNAEIFSVSCSDLFADVLTRPRESSRIFPFRKLLAQLSNRRTCYVAG